jgi:hypothetical protein
MLKQVQHDAGGKRAPAAVQFPAFRLTLTETSLSVAAARRGPGYCKFLFKTELLRDCHKGRKPAEKCGFWLAGAGPFQ